MNSPLGEIGMRLIKELEQTLLENADKALAKKQAAYMRQLFPFLGLRTPHRRALVKPLYKSHPIRDEEQFIRALNDLWGREHREFQYAALDIAAGFKKLASEEMLKVYEAMIRTKSWWDTVDDIAANLVGPLIANHPKLLREMDRWIDDENLWIRRTALIFQLKWKKNTDTDRLFDYCRKTMHDPDFFIRKAIGWALRQYSKTDAVAVKQFIQNNKNQLSSLSIKEGSKYV
jgi:3-methyladenine DNA glycosylase AlkD